MILKTLSLINYKNFESQNFTFDTKINCFVGQNGIGKTNVLDSIYHLSFSKSYFNPISTQNIKHDEHFFVIDGVFEKDQRQEKIIVSLKKGQKKIIKRNGKIYVSLEARLLFASGSIEVETEGQRALVDLAKVLESEKDLEIIVEGHTDTDKMAGTKHPKNNWELSVLRSTSVIAIMLANSSIDPTQLMAAGRSEFIPVDVDDKAKNRRIEIIISPNLNELYELISD